MRETIVMIEAVSRRKIIGYLFLSLEQVRPMPRSNRPQVASVDSVYVEENFRRQGVATKLLTCAKSLTEKYPGLSEAVTVTVAPYLEVGNIKPGMSATQLKKFYGKFGLKFNK